MDKNNIQDVVPPSQKRSIRDIPIPARGNKINSIKKERSDTNHNHDIPPIHIKNDDPFDNLEEPKKRNNKFIPLAALFGLVFVVFIVFVLLSVFSNSTITATAKTETKPFDEKILVENLSERKNQESLGYRVIELSQEVSKTVPAIDEELVQEKASGQITIFNEYTDETQKLIKNTRFESSNGRIYRIQESVEVPGYKEGADGKITPGELLVTVYADEVGESYNLDSDEFTVPGFKGQEPYDFFYAKTKTSISGGYDGIRKIVSEDTINDAKSELEIELKDKLVLELQDNVTDEFYTYYNDSSFVFNKINQEEVDGSDDVKLIMRGSITAKLFNKIDLSNAIADNIFSDYKNDENTLIDDLNSINIEYMKEESEEQNGEFINVSSNSSEFVWQIDSIQLKEDLVGQKQASLSTIMQSHKGILKAESVISPFWKSSFPEDSSDIKINIVK